MDLEWIWRLGSIGGLVSAIALIWGWLWRDRPFVEFKVEPTFFDSNTYPEFLVRASEASSIAVTGIRVFPERFQVWRDRSTRSAVGGALNRNFNAIVSSGQVVTFPLVVLTNKLGVCFCVLFWRSMRSPSRWQVPIFKWINTKTILKLEQEFGYDE